MEKVWLKNYQSGVPENINPDAYSSINEIFEEVSRLYADRPAYANMGTILTYRALAEQVKKFAAFLQQELKLQPGDRFAIMMPNLLQYPIVMFGALQAGLIVVAVNPLYTARELEFQLSDSGVEAIVVLSNFAHTLAQVLDKTALKHIIVTDIGDCFNFPKSWLVNFVVKFIKKMVPPFHIANTIRFKDALRIGSKQNFQKPKITSQDIAYLQYTGGTTGVAKSAVLLHRNMVANLEQAFVWVKPNLKLGKEIVITALPLYHIFSLTANCLTFLKIGALNVLITNPRDTPRFVKELRKYPFTAITGVNTLFNALLHYPDFAKLDFSHLRIALGGGMAVQRAVAERWQSVTHTTLLEAYGLTEASPAVCINPLDLKGFNGSIGLPVPSTDVSIRDDAGKELSFNEPGELWVKGPQVMKEYWNRPDETQKALTDGWLKTGDIATIDDQGFVRIIDRKKDMILVSGFNVYPTEVEDVIAMLPSVAEVAVVGVSREIGEVVKAFIVKRDPQLTLEQVKQHCHQQLTSYKVPKEIEFCQVLPKSNVGKILRRALREPKQDHG